MEEQPMHEIRTAEPAGYAEFVAELKQRIERAQLRASLAVNGELVLLYWQIGREILSRQDRENWGAKVIERLAADLKRSFPDMRGFSPRNLKYMRRFAEAWPERPIVQQAAALLSSLGKFCEAGSCFENEGGVPGHDRFLIADLRIERFQLFVPPPKCRLTPCASA